MKPRTLVLYGLPLLAVGFSWNMVTVYFLKYATDVLLIAPGAVGLIFGLSRLWDAISDPLAGYWSDRTRTRLGRRRPWMLAACLPLGVLIVALWAPPRQLEGGALLGWIAVSVFLYYTVLTAFRIPHVALGAELSSDSHERTRAFTAAHLFELVGGLLGLAALAILIETRVEPRTGLLGIATVTALASVGLIAFCAWRLREPAAHLGRGATEPWRAAKDIWANRPARQLLGMSILQTSGISCIAAAIPYVAEYHFGDLAYMPVLVMAFVIAGLFATPLWAPLSRRFGKVRVWIAAQSLELLVLGALVLPGSEQLAVTLALVALLGASDSAGAVLGLALRADVIDLDEAATGERKEGSYFAAWNVAWKSGVGISVLIVGATLQLSGFAPGVEQTPAATWALRALVSGIPCVLFGAGFLMLLRFRLDLGAAPARDRAQRARARSSSGWIRPLV